jgi:hypothetical protein
MTSAKFRTIIRLAIEYLLITLPIIIYVTLEAIHQGDAVYLLQSPEWSIATIFLSCQTVRLFLEGLERDRGRLVGVVLVVALVVLIVVASINIYMGLDSEPEGQSWMVLVTKWGLLTVATLFFVYFAGATIWAQEAEQ